MAEPLDCPATESWQALFDDVVPPERRADYERHLESCPTCQARLDRCGADSDTLLTLVREVGDSGTLLDDPDLSRFLHRLRDGVSPLRPVPAEPNDLRFLAPAARPGVLGTVGPYEVEEVIGRGGMGVVLKAFDPRLHRHVALKVLVPELAASPTARRRFTREGQAVAAVCHENVVAVHGVAEVDGLPYLVMPYVAGESLQHRLQRTGPLELAEVVRIGQEAASGLAAAHARGLIHRDIKPANLLLEGDPARVKITDFGLARSLDDLPLTQQGVVAGTPEYMAPEQARGEPIDHRADLFALGAVLYACCTGEPPFRAETPLAVLRQVSEAAPAPLRERNPGVPAWLDAVVARLLAKDPADRFQSAAEVAALLEAYLAHLRQPGTFPAAGLPPAGRAARTSGAGRWFRRPAWLLAAVLLAAGLGAALVPPAAPPAEPAPAGEFYQDFRGGQSPAPPLILTGSDAEAVTRPEAEGFRITLPASRPRTDRVGIVLETRVRGDFEITSTYEILRVDHPTEGHGVGFDLFAETASAKHDVAEVSRTVRVNEGDVYCCCLASTDDEGKRTYQLRMNPTAAKKGGLRLTRLGREVTCWAAEGAGQFEELCRYDIGTEDVTRITACAYPGFAQNPVDLRVQDLRVHLLNRAEVGALERSAAQHSYGGSRGWLAAAGLIGLILFLAALGVWYLAGRHPRAAAGPAAAAPEPVQAAGAEAPPVSLTCPGCGKVLKARAALAGKRVRCPHCHKPVQVPGPQTGETGFTPA